MSFVGGNEAGQAIALRSYQSGKRVQANLGAKNHAVILPDADKQATISALLGSAFGAAGQRCMAISVAIFIGEKNHTTPSPTNSLTRLFYFNDNTNNLYYYLW